MGKTNFSRLKKAAKPAKPPHPTPHTEPSHPSTELITPSTFPFSDLIPTWATFNPNTKNGATGSVFSSGHHGGSGGKKISDFKTFRLACCLEFVDKEVDGMRYRVRCMNVFTVDSNQCTTHRKTIYKDGPNRIYTLMKRGEVGDWGMLRDAEAVVRPCRAAEWRAQQCVQDGAAERLDEVAANMEGLRVAENAVNAKVRFDEKLESDVGGGVVVDDKGKGGVGGKKGGKSRWKGTQMRPISEK